MKALKLLVGGIAVLMTALMATAQPTQLVSGLASGSGSAVGPGAALFVTEGVTGTIFRIDPRTGEVTTFASGLPPQLIPGLGGAIDVAFIGETAYALVTLVGPDIGGTAVSGIYRVDGPSSFTVIADLGLYSVNNPPNTAYFVAGGVQYAIEAYRGGFLVTDGHHNRLLHVTVAGEIEEVLALDNVVPTGLAVSGDTVYLALAGPVPHVPADGRVVAFDPESTALSEVANGARLAVDVEFGRGRQQYVLSQGIWDGPAEGSPALPDTGALFEIDEAGGGVTLVADGLDRPTSMEIIGNTAYIVTLDGEIWRIDGIGVPPFGKGG